MRRIVIFLLAFGLVIGAQPKQAAKAAQRCFTETNQCMEGRIAEFWEQNGGLSVFGFPISGQEQSTVDGKTFTVQRFERNRLELHPENKRPYDVLLGRLGADRLGQQGRDWFGFAKSSDTGGCRVFAETGHAVCGAVLKAWRSNGLQIDGKKSVSDAESLALFGMPLSGLMTESLSDGKQYQVQWFERARFELHPENAAPYDVLLGLLGNEVGGAAVPAPAAAAPAASGPGSLFVPMPKRMFASYMLEQLRFVNVEFTPQWKVSSNFANGLADKTATVVPTKELVDGVVQYMRVDSIMSSPSGHAWALTYQISEFVKNVDALRFYQGVDPVGVFTIEPTETKYLTANGCRLAYVQGITTNYIAGMRMLMNCENKVLIMDVFGHGTTEEFDTLWFNVQKFFANSFRW